MGTVNIETICVGILEGGVSQEREISLQSAEQVARSLERQRINAVRIDINTRDEHTIKKHIKDTGIDVAFVALHGEFGEDGTIQAILESMHIPYTGSGPGASGRAMNKIAAKTTFVQEGIPTSPFSQIAKSKDSSHRETITANHVSSPIHYPVVVKPNCNGSSLGISIVHNRSELAAALDEAFAFDEKLIIEDYIEGRELTVGILDDVPLGVVEIIPKDSYFDFTTKYSDGRVVFVSPAEIPHDIYQKVQYWALRAHQSLGCQHFSRVDIILNAKNIPFILEVNSIPGLTSHSLLPLSAQCQGIDFDCLIKKMIVLAIRDRTPHKEGIFKVNA